MPLRSNLDFKLREDREMLQMLEAIGKEQESLKYTIEEYPSTEELDLYMDRIYRDCG